MLKFLVGAIEDLVMEKLIPLIAIQLIFISLPVLPTDKNYCYKIINEVWKTRSYQKGVTELHKAIKEHPDTADFFSNLVFLYYHTKQHKKGYLLADLAFIYYRLQGHILYRDNRIEQASKVLDRAYQAFMGSPGGKRYHFYHLKRNTLKVKKGDRVRAGQPMAEMGNSSSTIPHLHFGVYSRDWMVSYPVYFSGYCRVRGGEKKPVKADRPGGDGGSELIFVE
jgi:tetratricopeptide (TPR) repeat protein